MTAPRLKMIYIRKVQVTPEQERKAARREDWNDYRNGGLFYGLG